MLIAHLSDSHVLTGGRRLADRFDTGAAFDRLVASLAALTVRPDVILFSGDLGEDATEEEYAHVGAGLRSLGLPVLAVPGNHDARAPMLAQLPDMVRETGSGHLCLCEDLGPLVVIGLDTLVPGTPHGELCADRLAWLDTQLKTHQDRDVLIIMHHPPLETGLQDMDSMGLLSGRDALAAQVAAHGRVRAILCGHMHRAIQGSFGGAPVRVSPSASHQIAFDLRPGVPYAFSDEPAQFMMHRFGADGSLVSHVVSVG
ncbi:phosphodiesterase [Pseudooceanicola nanhaiensis]|uniref:phosphodiesterase n=1 Tax=Pseudooceanicola nanhaiensis TaxID=375761 RepID=UPI001CD5647A|nr:phosphodiesterase [Pseudooceanicola nanhaiensis]MCA0922848.1 phosphodiesterase [Pseudooceanicola nanhaiensis]